MCSLIVGAAILGIIIGVMEQEDFPGWGKMVLCVLAALLPAALVNTFLPPELFFVGLAVGSLCAGLAISALCGMSVQRAAIAAGIYLAIQTALSFALQAMMAS